MSSAPRPPVQPDDESFLVYARGADKARTKTWWVYWKADRKREQPVERIAWIETGKLRGHQFLPAPEEAFSSRALRDLATFCETATADHRAERRGR